MADTGTTMDEFRFLDEKRRSSGLAPAEEQRWDELRQALGATEQALEVPPEQQGYYADDGNWYPGVPQYAQGYAPVPYDPNTYAYPPGQIFDPSTGMFQPDPMQPYGYAGPYDSNGAPAYDPNAVAYDANGAPYDPNAAPYDPNAQYAQNGQPYAGYGYYPPQGYPADPNSQYGYDPQYQPYPPGYDPNPPPAEAFPLQEYPVDPAALGPTETAAAAEVTSAAEEPTSNAPEAVPELTATASDNQAEALSSVTDVALPAPVAAVSEALPSLPESAEAVTAGEPHAIETLAVEPALETSLPSAGDSVTEIGSAVVASDDVPVAHEAIGDIGGAPPAIETLAFEPALETSLPSPSDSVLGLGLGSAAAIDVAVAYEADVESAQVAEAAATPASASFAEPPTEPFATELAPTAVETPPTEQVADVSVPETIAAEPPFEVEGEVVRSAEASALEASSETLVSDDLPLGPSPSPEVLATPTASPDEVMEVDSLDLVSEPADEPPPAAAVDARLAPGIDAVPEPEPPAPGVSALASPSLDAVPEPELPTDAPAIEARTDDSVPDATDSAELAEEEATPVSATPAIEVVRFTPKPNLVPAQADNLTVDNIPRIGQDEITQEVDLSLVQAAPPLAADEEAVPLESNSASTQTDAWSLVPDAGQPVEGLNAETEAPTLELSGSPDDVVQLAANNDFVEYQPQTNDSTPLELDAHEAAPTIEQGALADIAQDAAVFHAGAQAPSNTAVDPASESWLLDAPEMPLDAVVAVEEPAPIDAGPEVTQEVEWLAPVIEADPTPVEAEPEAIIEEAPAPMAAVSRPALEDTVDIDISMSGPRELPRAMAPIAAPEIELEAEIVIEPEPEAEIELVEEELEPVVAVQPPVRAPFARPPAIPAIAPAAMPLRVAAATPARPMPVALQAAALPVEASEIELSSTGGINPSFIEGEHRVIIHTLEGQVKRGTIRDVDLLDDAISLVQAGTTPERISTKRVKAIFFMLPAGNKQPPASGQKIRVTFNDGRQVAGFSFDYRNTNDPGFFVVPADNRTNTARIYIFRASVQAVVAG